MVSAYDEAIAYVDEELGAFFSELEEMGLYEESLIIISADHGETMGESDYLFGHGVLEESVLHVPLLIRFPGGKGAGTRVPGTVQLTDLFPTVLDQVGAKPRNFLQGRSLVAALADPESTRPVAFSSGGLMRQACIYSGRWKLVAKQPGIDSSKAVLLTLPHLNQNWEGTVLPSLRQSLLPWQYAVLEEMNVRGSVLDLVGEEGLTNTNMERIEALEGFDVLLHGLRVFYREPIYELYDLQADPLGRVDVSSSHPEVLARLTVELLREIARETDAQELAAPPASPVELSAEDIADLAAIGYVDDE